MKASELIKNLKRMVKESGDLNVAIQRYFEEDKSCIYDMNFVCYVENPSTKDTVYNDFGTIVEVENVISISYIS